MGLYLAHGNSAFVVVGGIICICAAVLGAGNTGGGFFMVAFGRMVWYAVGGVAG